MRERLALQEFFYIEDDQKYYSCYVYVLCLEFLYSWNSCRSQSPFYDAMTNGEFGEGGCRLIERSSKFLTTQREKRYILLKNTVCIYMYIYMMVIMDSCPNKSSLPYCIAPSPGTQIFPSSVW